MTPQEYAQSVEELEPEVERLKALYSQYFMGIEKLEPTIVRKKVDRLFFQLKRERMNNTALRFRLQQLWQRYVTYQQYWARILRQIEKGTYKRDVIRAAKRVGVDAASAAGGLSAASLLKSIAPDPEEMTPPRGLQVAAESNGPDDDEATPPSLRVHQLPTLEPPGYGNGHPPAPEPPEPPTAPPPPQKRGRPLPPPRKREASAPAGGEPAPRQAPVPRAPAPSPEEQRTREIYAQYIAAKRSAGESTAGVTYDKLAKSLGEQRTRLRERHGQRDVDFEVLFKDGKAVIRPVVK